MSGLIGGAEFGRAAVPAAAAGSLERLQLLYSDAVDKDDPEAVVRLFDPDAEFLPIGADRPFVGHDQLAAYFASLLASRISVHRVLSSQAWSGPSGQVVGMCRASVLIEQDATNWTSRDVIYFDVYRETGDGWSFASRRVYEADVVL